jgi:hypothetical protein
MSRARSATRRVLAFVSLWLPALALVADPLAPNPPGLTCAQLVGLCSGSTPEQVYSLAEYQQGGGTTQLGTCYAHSASVPEFAAYEYVKQSWRPDPKGFDGGTGAIIASTPEEARARAGATLKLLCESGQCCCPIVGVSTCPNAAPVSALDPTSGSICTFPNRCSAPLDWQLLVVN